MKSVDEVVVQHCQHMMDEINDILVACEQGAATIEQPVAEKCLSRVQTFYQPMLEVLQKVLVCIQADAKPSEEWEKALCRFENHYGTSDGMTNGLPHQVSNDLVFLIRQQSNKRELIHRCVRVDTLSSSTITEILTYADNHLKNIQQPQQSNWSSGTGLPH